MISKLEEDAANNATFGKMGMGKMGMVSFFLRTWGCPGAFAPGAARSVQFVDIKKLWNAFI